MEKLKKWSKVSILIVTLLIIFVLLNSMTSFAKTEAEQGIIDIKLDVSNKVTVFNVASDINMGVFCIEHGKSANNGKYIPVSTTYSMNNTQKLIFAKYFDLIESKQYKLDDIKRAVQLANWKSLGTAGNLTLTGDAKKIYDMLSEMSAKEASNVGKAPVKEATTTVLTKVIDTSEIRAVKEGNKQVASNLKLKGSKFGPFRIEQLMSLGSIKDFYLEVNGTKYTNIKIMDSSDNIITDWKEGYLEYYKNKDFYIYIDDGVIPAEDLDKLEFKLSWGYSEATAVVYKQCARNSDGSYVIKNGEYQVTPFDKQKVVRIEAVSKTPIELTFGFKVTNQEFDITLIKYGITSYNSNGTVERVVLPGTVFKIESDAIPDGVVEKTTDVEGQIYLNKLQGFGNIEFKITEISVPGSYVKNGPITLNIHRDADGTIKQVGDITITTYITDHTGYPSPDITKAPCVFAGGINRMGMEIYNSPGELRIKKIDSVTGKEIIGKSGEFEFLYKAAHRNINADPIIQKLIVDENGYTVIAYPFSQVGIMDFEILEVASPAGYIKLEDTIKFSIKKTEDGTVSILSSNFDEINRKNGFTENNKKVSISDLRVSSDGKGISVNLVVPNIPQKNDGFRFRLIKTDASGSVLPGAEFDITSDAFTGSKTIRRTTDKNGYMDLTSYLNQNVYGNITFTINEVNPPANYEKVGEWGTKGKVITINRDKNTGNITIVQDSNYNRYFKNDSFASARVDSKVQLTLTIQNKYIPESTPGGMSGYVWLQENKIDSNTNYVLDNGDIRLQKVRVILYRDGSSYKNTETDVNGRYSFGDVKDGYWTYYSDGTPKEYIKYRYYVVFEYNGEEYIPIPRVSESNKMTANYSKSVETASDRNAITNHLKLITSSNGRNTNSIKSYITEVKDKTQVPVYNDVTTITAKSYTYEAGASNINLGLMRRPKANLALLKDIVDVTFNINGKTETYKYDMKIDADGNEYFEVEPKDNDIIYAIGTQIPVNNNLVSTIKQNGEISTEDYLRQSDERYRIDTYSENNPANGTTEAGVSSGTHAGVLGAAESNELTIDLRYRITVKNTGAVPAAVKELVDYYDASQMTLTEVRDEAGNLLASNFRAEKYGDYQKNFIEALNKVVLEPGGKAKTLYFTFRLTKNASRDLLTADKNNYAEINAFTAYIPATYENTIKYAKNGANLNIVTDPYLAEQGLISKECIREWVNTWETTVEQGTNRMIFGRRDVNSVPGNYMPGLDYKLDNTGRWSAVKDGVTYYTEDDNDAAPVFRIKVMSPDKNRKLNGNVWEDLKKAGLDIGLRDGEKEPNIKGIKVELIEMKSTGGVFVFGTTRTDENGYYKFENFIPGNYLVRFTYGDSTYVVKSDNTVDADKLKDMLVVKTVDVKDADGNTIGIQDVVTMYSGLDYESTIYQNINTATINTERDSNAEDNEYRREEVNAFGKPISNEKGELIDVSTLVGGIDNVEYDSATGKVIKIKSAALVNLANLKTVLEKTYMNSYTDVMAIQVEDNGREHVDLGIIERERFNVVLEKRISAVRFTPEGAEPFEFSIEENGELKNESGIIKMGKQGGLYLIQINEYLMQGELEVEYTIKVKNTSNVAGSVDKIIDYVNFVDNTMAYRSETKFITDSTKTNNNYWKEVKSNELSNLDNIATGYKNGLNVDIAKTLDENYSNRLYLVADTPLQLAEGAEKEIKLIVGKTTVRTGSADELTATNTAEIVQYTNIAGRRDYLSIPGDYNPAIEEFKQVLSDRTYQPDTSSSAKLSIIPPLGDDSIDGMYYALAAIGLAIVAAAVVIKKKRLIRL